MSGYTSRFLSALRAVGNRTEVTDDLGYFLEKVDERNLKWIDVKVTGSIQRIYKKDKDENPTESEAYRVCLDAEARSRYSRGRKGEKPAIVYQRGMCNKSEVLVNSDLPDFTERSIVNFSRSFLSDYKQSTEKKMRRNVGHPITITWPSFSESK